LNGAPKHAAQLDARQPKFATKRTTSGKSCDTSSVMIVQEAGNSIRYKCFRPHKVNGSGREYEDTGSVTGLLRYCRLERVTDCDARCQSRQR